MIADGAYLQEFFRIHQFLYKLEKGTIAVETFPAALMRHVE